MRTKITITTVLLAFIGALFAVPSTASAGVETQIHPNLARGDGPGKVVDRSQWDSINLFNGNLNLALPLGPWYPLREGFGYQLVLHYNSNVWDYNQTTGAVISANPTRFSNAGVGWDLSLGRLVDPFAADNQSRKWIYISPNGALHPFYSALHSDVFEPDDNVFYTRDGTYYRLQQTGANTCLVESADGTVKTFELAKGEWRLTKMADRFTNYLSISYATPNVWALADNHGRSLAIYFKGDPTGAYPQIVDRVVASAFAGTTATYTFTYTTGAVSRPAVDNDASTAAAVNLPLLSSVTAPDGSKHTFTYHPTTAASDSSGRLASLVLPTLGKIEWAYQKYSFTSPTCASTLGAIYRTTTGVAKRTMVEASGVVAGSWNYAAGVKSLGDPARCADEGEMSNTVTTPAGDKTVYYFSTNVTGTTTSRWDRSDYALPLTKDEAEAVSGNYLSRRIFDCDGAGNNCQLLQSLYVRYAQDQPSDPNSPETGNTNRREISERVLYHDDLENGTVRFSGVERSDFDGLGHFRREVTNGNFGSADARELLVDYNALNGTYPSAGFVMPPTSQAWVLNTYGKKKEVEASSSRVVEACFDRDTGFLRRQRKWSSTSTSGTAGSNDLLIVYTPDAAGHLVKEQYYGGDVQPIDTASLCALSVPPSDQYQVRHTYQYGSLSGSQYYTGAGAAFGTKFVDREIDKNTGLVKTSRDSAGLATQQEYDSMGRVTWVKPQAGHGAWTQYLRTVAAGADYAKTIVYKKQNGGGGLLTYKADVQDSFGRVWWEQTSSADGSYPNRYTHRNAMGWVTHKSEYSNEAPKYTLYSNHDPFGRARVLTPPEGDYHNINYEYAGFRGVKRTAQVGWTYYQPTGQVLEQPRPTVQLYDRQGRLWKEMLQAGSNPSPQDRVTVNEYDVAGRLWRKTENGALVGSNYHYDGRGFLFLVVDANNSGASYAQFDALGNAQRQRPGNSELAYIYDRAGRLIKVQDAADASKIWKEFIYADSNGTGDWRAGKLWVTRRYNYTFGYPSLYVVSETNTYGGKDGRLSRYEVENAAAPLPLERFAQTYVYDELGNVTELGYPNSTAEGGGNMGRDRKVVYGYVNDRMTKIDGTLDGLPENWATSLSYHANGLTNRIAHSNGVTDTFTSSPHGYPRPAAIATSGVKSISPRQDNNFYSGEIQYDGAGNVVRMGNRPFIPAAVGPSGSIATQYYPPCPSALDAFGQPTGSYYNGSCTAETIYLYNAQDVLVKTVGIAGISSNSKQTWTFYGLSGQLMTNYVRLSGANGAWVSTRDYIYESALLLAVADSLRDAPYGRKLHFHTGFRLPGIWTDAGGYRTSLAGQ